jgi:hypothetical protein
MLASEVMDEAAALMNDAQKFTWGYTQLLPYLRRAYGTMELHLFLNGVRDLKEVSAVLQVTALSPTVTLLPTDFVQAISMEERASGSTDVFFPVVESDWEQDLKSDSILYWNWRESGLKINPPNVNREIRLKYRKGLTPILGENTNITILLSKPYLSAKTAANASAFGAANAERAAILNSEANSELSMLINSEIRNQQGVSFRRRGYGAARRARRGG